MAGAVVQTKLACPPSPRKLETSAPVTLGGERDPLPRLGPCPDSFSRQGKVTFPTPIREGGDTKRSTERVRPTGKVVGAMRAVDSRLIVQQGGGSRLAILEKSLLATVSTAILNTAVAVMYAWQREGPQSSSKGSEGNHSKESLSTAERAPTPTMPVPALLA